MNYEYPIIGEWTDCYSMIFNLSGVVILLPEHKICIYLFILVIFETFWRLFVFFREYWVTYLYNV